MTVGEGLSEELVSL